MLVIYYRFCIKQVQDILDWLLDQNGPGEGIARIRILDSVSAALQRWEFAEAVSKRIFDMVFSENVRDKDLPDAASVARWAVAERLIDKVDIKLIWARTKSDVDRLVQKSSIRKHKTFAGFKYCVAMWLGSGSDGPILEEVGAMVCSLVDKIDKSKSKSQKASAEGVLTSANYTAWMLLESPHLLRYASECNPVVCP